MLRLRMYFLSLKGPYIESLNSFSTQRILFCMFWCLSFLYPYYIYSIFTGLLLPFWCINATNCEFPPFSCRNLLINTLFYSPAPLVVTISLTYWTWKFMNFCKRNQQQKLCIQCEIDKRKGKNSNIRRIWEEITVYIQCEKMCRYHIGGHTHMCVRTLLGM